MAGQTTNYLFDYPTSTDYVKDGATAIQTLATDVDTTLFTALGGAYPGLRLVKKQTIGSGVASVTVTGAFSATYDNYKIMVTGGVGSINSDISIRMGTNSAANYQYTAVYNSYSSGTALGFANANQTEFRYFGSSTTTSLEMNVEVSDPFLTRTTRLSGGMNESRSGGLTMNVKGYLNDTTSYTSFTLLAGGTLTGGTIYVYGYGAS